MKTDVDIIKFIQNCIKSIDIDFDIDVEDLITNIVNKIIDEDILSQTVEKMLIEYKNNISAEQKLFKAIQDSNITFEEGKNYFYIDGYLHISKKILGKIYPSLNYRIRNTTTTKNNIIIDLNKQVCADNNKKLRCLVFETSKLPNSIIQKMPMITNRTWGGSRRGK